MVITDGVPMGCDAMPRSSASISCWDRLTTGACGPLVPREMNTGFWFQGSRRQKISLRPWWRRRMSLAGLGRRRVRLDLEIHWNGQWFGRPQRGGRCISHFGELIAARALHAANEGAGHCGGFSNGVERADGSGSACISERRVIEIIQQGKPVTGFMKFGDRVTMKPRAMPRGARPGVIDRRVVAAAARWARDVEPAVVGRGLHRLSGPARCGTDDRGSRLVQSAGAGSWRRRGL